MSLSSGIGEILDYTLVIPRFTTTLFHVLYGEDTTKDITDIISFNIKFNDTQLFSDDLYFRCIFKDYNLFAEHQLKNYTISSPVHAVSKLSISTINSIALIKFMGVKKFVVFNLFGFGLNLFIRQLKVERIY